ncbi:MAG: LysM peptidoglycan-binding domain-containing protein [Polyangia bacterium]|jgi:hypothetical protein|nr:LysM peptidoglycan-binding domain-containing protein [Polyangia bacterium]
MRRLTPVAVALMAAGVGTAWAQAPAGQAPSAAPAAPKGAGGAEPRQSEAEPNTYEIYDSGDRSEPLVRREGEASLPIYHTVAKGDTLWGLCESYFKDPFRWPKVWAKNPSITNPHWIYPGDRIRLREGDAPKPEARKAEPLKPYSNSQALPDTIYLRQRGFIEEDEIKYAAKIVGSREEKTLLATHDHVYVRYPNDKPLKVGERYDIYKALNPVKHPQSKETLGQMVEVFGEVEIRELSKSGVARGIILRAVNPVERGYLVGKLTRVIKTVRPIPNTRTRVEGSVVAVLEQAHLIGAKQVVFIDRGRKFHVKPGYTFYVTRRGDSYRATSQFEERVNPAEQRWPRERVAAIVVVEVGWSHSVGFVSQSVKEIRIGDRVELLVDTPSTR